MGVAAAAVAAAVFAFAPPWLAHLYVDRAYRAPVPATDLSRARRLDPLSLESYWAAWRLAPGPAGQIQALRGAERVEPSSVAVLYQLGLAYLRAGRRADAHRVLLRATLLDPRGSDVRRALGEDSG